MKAHPSRLGPQYAPQIAELEKMCFDQPWSEEQCRQAFAQPAYAAFGMPGADILLAYISLSTLPCARNAAGRGMDAGCFFWPCKPGAK